jgi:hypothetical protein
MLRAACLDNKRMTIEAHVASRLSGLKTRHNLYFKMHGIPRLMAVRCRPAKMPSGEVAEDLPAAEDLAGGLGPFFALKALLRAVIQLNIQRGRGRREQGIDSAEAKAAKSAGSGESASRAKISAINGIQTRLSLG